MITERDLQVLQAVVHYYCLNRQQIQRLCFPEDSSGRVTRRRLSALVDANLLNRMKSQVYNLQAGSPSSVYYPAKRGNELMAEHFDDERLLLTPTQTPQTHHIFHWLAVAETHIALDQALERQAVVKLDGWFNEWDTVNTEESAPERRYRIYSLLRESPRLVCAHDAAFCLTVGQFSKVFYLEQDRNTSGVKQVAASKTPGYAVMESQQAQQRHFPQAKSGGLSVLMVAPSPSRRDALRKAIKEKNGAALWKFVSVTDLSAESFLFEPIWYSCTEGPSPLVKAQVLEASRSS